MTKTDVLREKIRQSGYKLAFIAEKCGLTYAGLLKKINNETEFKASEVAILRDLLNLTDAEVQDIFLD